MTCTRQGPVWVAFPASLICIALHKGMLSLHACVATMPACAPPASPESTRQPGRHKWPSNGADHIFVMRHALSIGGLEMGLSLPGKYCLVLAHLQYGLRDGIRDTFILPGLVSCWHMPVRCLASPTPARQMRTRQLPVKSLSVKCHAGNGLYTWLGTGGYIR